MIYVHIHVPRTGGTTFSRIMKDNFGRAYAKETDLLCSARHRYTAADFADVMQLHPSMRAYSYHRATIDLPYDRGVQAIAWIRNPVDRLISIYSYLRGDGIHFDKRAKRMTLMEYADEVMRSPGAGSNIAAQFAHTQVGFLVNSATPTDGDRARIEALVHSDALLLLPFWMYTDACMLLERMFPGDFVDCSSGGMLNASSPLIVADGDRFKLIDRLMPDEAWLLELADEQFTRLVMEHYRSRDDVEAHTSEFSKRRNGPVLRNLVRRRVKGWLNP